MKILNEIIGTVWFDLVNRDIERAFEALTLKQQSHVYPSIGVQAVHAKAENRNREGE